MDARNGVLLVISAPSGTGKSTLVRELLSRMDGVEFSVSFRSGTVEITTSSTGTGSTR
jgi:guanylate kinase